jgi:hypothetical protein
MRRVVEKRYWREEDRGRRKSALGEGGGGKGEE